MKILRSIWRDASLTPRLLGIDARAFFPLLGWLYHPRLWTFAMAGITVLSFFLMEKRGYSLPVLLRTIRHKLRGTVVAARSGWLRY